MCTINFQLVLTGSSGLAGVDVSDDDDVDMSLLLTAEMENVLATLIDMILRLNSRSEGERRQIGDDRLPHGGG